MMQFFHLSPLGWKMIHTTVCVRVWAEFKRGLTIDTYLIAFQ